MQKQQQTSKTEPESTSKRTRTLETVNNLAAGSGVHFEPDPDNTRRTIMVYKGGGMVPATILTPVTPSTCRWSFNVALRRTDRRRVYMFLLQKSADDTRPKFIAMSDLALGILNWAYAADGSLGRVNLRFHERDGRVFEQHGDVAATDFTELVDDFEEIIYEMLHWGV